MRLVPTPLPRLLIADHDPAAGAGLGAALRTRFEIVDTVCDARSAVARAAACGPDAVVLEVDLPGGGAPSALRGIAAISPVTAIIVVSREGCELPVLDLLRCGAMSCCLTELDPARLGDAIERAIGARQAPVLSRAA